MAFLERVRQAYLERARAHPDRYAVIDATLTIKEVAAAIRQSLEERLA